jgi:hypothetical protein
MSAHCRILRSLDPHHQRLGYLNGVVLCCVRELDSREALTARFHDLMFERIYEDDPRWPSLHELVAEDEVKPLADIMKRLSHDDPTSVFLKGNSASHWLFIHDLWRSSTEIYSRLGRLGNEEEKLSRPIELAKWFQLILPTYELSELGVVLRSILEERKRIDGNAFNPLKVRGVQELQLLYLRMMIESDCLFAILVDEFASRFTTGVRITTRGPDGLLRAAVERIIKTLGEPSRPDEILAIQQVYEFRDAILKSLSTEENYLRPRMEMLVDVAIIDRVQQGKSNEFQWVPTEVTRRATREWQRLLTLTEDPSRYLDREFFGSMNKIYDLDKRGISSEREALGYFAKAFSMAGREFGFTPARTLALTACLLAWREEVILELSAVLEAVQNAAKNEFGQFLHFSGGSRFDGEFLIRVDPKLQSVLDAES